MPRTVASNLRGCKAKESMISAAMNFGSIRKVKKMKNESRSGDECFCICMMVSTPMRYSDRLKK